MKVLWAPWRLRYVQSADQPVGGCIFCDKPELDSPTERREALVLRTTPDVSVLMNLYPYANGHLMVAPRKHTADFAAQPPALGNELQRELERAVAVLRKAYNPAGFNIGMNLGAAGGAGIVDHMHWHIVPRWVGDTNFMTSLGEVRVLPEHIMNTYDKLLPLFEEAS